ncbi:hypothetical protein ACFQRC_03060 [Enterovirga sp. GCM10030262]|uniref:hypothetical protein n=1 Tax=Enterovirga sp. GCM10030262 TaxID=3273391 RepID=UPI00360BB8E7
MPGAATPPPPPRKPGVCERTVYAYRRKDTVFAGEFQEALEQGYVRLEGEAVRQRLGAQQRLREAIEEAEPTALLSGEAANEFERVMKLLAGWDRRGGRPAPREWRHGHQKRMSFDDAITLLDKRLRALGVRRGVPPGSRWNERVGAWVPAVCAGGGSGIGSRK